MCNLQQWIAVKPQKAVQPTSQVITTPCSFPHSLLHTRRSTADKHTSSRMEWHSKAQVTQQTCLLRKTVVVQVFPSRYKMKITFQKQSLETIISDDLGTSRSRDKAHNSGTDCITCPGWPAPSLRQHAQVLLAASQPELRGPAFKPSDHGTKALTVTWGTFVKSPAPSSRAQVCKWQGCVCSRQPMAKVIES